MSQDQNVCKDEVYHDLFKSLAKPIRNFLVYKGSDVEEANDIVQDTFIKLWENCKKVLPEKAKSYLYTLAGNAFKNEMAHLKVKLKYSTSNVIETVNIETPEFKMEESEFKIQLESAISSLPQNQREVFLLNRIEQKKYREIAEILDLSVKAIEKRMGLALKHIRQRIINFK